MSDFSRFLRSWCERRYSPNFGGCGQEEQCDPGVHEPFVQQDDAVQPMGCCPATSCFFSTSAKNGIMDILQLLFPVDSISSEQIRVTACMTGR